MLDFLRKKLSWLVLQYELITCLDMFEPWEQACLTTENPIAPLNSASYGEQCIPDGSFVQQCIRNFERIIDLVHQIEAMRIKLRGKYTQVFFITLCARAFGHIGPDYATVLLVASLVSYSTYVYLPHYMMSLINSIWSTVSTGEERLEYRYESG